MKAKFILTTTGLVCLALGSLIDDLVYSFVLVPADCSPVSMFIHPKMTMHLYRNPIAWVGPTVMALGAILALVGVSLRTRTVSSGMCDTQLQKAPNTKGGGSPTGETGVNAGQDRSTRIRNVTRKPSRQHPPTTPSG